MSSLSETLSSLSMLATPEQLLQATGETLYMVVVSAIISTALGLPLGVLLHVTRKDQFMSRPRLNRVLGAFTNIGRSVPYIILMVSILPLTRFLVGSSIGTNAAIVSLTLSAIPFVARLIEGALNEVPPGLIEAAQAMGAKPMQIITKVLVPEALPGIFNSLTVTVVTLISYSAMAGAVAGGGLGALGINYGYQRFDGMTMLVTVIILVALVQLLQSVGDALVRRVDHR